MMRRADRHLDDEALLETLDDERAGDRESAITAHLRTCAACQGRQAALGEVLSATFTTGTDDEPRVAARTRARLAAAMHDDAVRQSRTATSRHTLSGYWRPHWVIAAAAIVLAAALGRWIPMRTFGAGFLARSEPYALPLSTYTPGATWAVGARPLCDGARYTRPVDAATRTQVIRAYGMDDVPATDYELDYLITPELGGATDARNLWPQRYASRTWNALVKDELEQLLPRLVCEGKVDLETAQREIAGNWIAAYQKYFRTEMPLHRQASRNVDDDFEIEALADVEYRYGAPAIRVVRLEPWLPGIVSHP